jgi:G3E family GTPase
LGYTSQLFQKIIAFLFNQICELDGDRSVLSRLTQSIVQTNNLCICHHFQEDIKLDRDMF